jgi:hypothetical protein
MLRGRRFAPAMGAARPRQAIQSCSPLLHALADPGTRHCSCLRRWGGASSRPPPPLHLAHPEGSTPPFPFPITLHPCTFHNPHLQWRSASVMPSPSPPPLPSPPRAPRRCQHPKPTAVGQPAALDYPWADSQLKVCHTLVGPHLGSSRRLDACSSSSSSRSRRQQQPQAAVTAAHPLGVLVAV